MLDLGLFSDDDDVPTAGDNAPRTAADGVTLVHAAPTLAPALKDDALAPTASTSLLKAPPAAPEPAAACSLVELLLASGPLFTPEEQAIMARLARPGPPCTFVVGAEAWLPRSDDAPGEDAGSPVPLPFDVEGEDPAAAHGPAPMEVEFEVVSLSDDDEQEEEEEEEDLEALLLSLAMEVGQ